MTLAPRGVPRPVPICFVAVARAAGWRLYSPLDEKPKAISDPRRLARVRDILVRPDVSVLVQRWSEDWDELAWLRIRGTAQLLERSAADVIGALREKYPQYAAHDLEGRPMLEVRVERVAAWSAGGRAADGG